LRNRGDLLWATLGEGGLVLAVAAIGLATNQPLIFASLGPTAYELVEQPRLPSARPYNIIVGHLIGLGAGFSDALPFECVGCPKRVGNGRRLYTAHVGRVRIGCTHYPWIPASKGRTACSSGDDFARHTGSDADSTGCHRHPCRDPIDHRNRRARAKVSSQAQAVNTSIFDAMFWLSEYAREF
jgi:hypothetical protein